MKNFVFEKFRKKTKCKKARFRSARDANKRAKRLNMRAYPCPACRGWHLTSQLKMSKGVSNVGQPTSA